MKQRRKLISILLALSMLLTNFFISVKAVAKENTEPKLDTSFFSDATIQVKSYSNDFSEIILTSTTKIQSNTLKLSNESTYSTTSLSFLSESNEEKNTILSRINEARGGGTIYGDDWFFGSSCYIYVSITYTTRTVSNGTEARINSVTTKYSTRNGTYVSSSVLRLVSMGSSSDSSSTPMDLEINVTTTPYTTTITSTWPWVNTEGPLLGAFYTVTATRPSGSSSSHTVSATV